MDTVTLIDATPVLADSVREGHADVTTKPAVWRCSKQTSPSIWVGVTKDDDEVAVARQRLASASAKDLASIDS